MICLGCGAEYVVECEACYERLKRCVTVFAHWPMETAMTPVALYHVERAIREYIGNTRNIGPERRAATTELEACASYIRAYLQHVAAGMTAYSDEPTDEELLA